MNEQLKKAKDILFGKTFCFMEWQSKDAKERGEKVMEKEDIEFILSLEGLQKGSILSFDGSTERFFPSSEQYVEGKLFEYIESAKTSGSLGMSIIEKDITNDEAKKVRQMGGCVNYTWAGGSTTLCDVYFTEEAFILSQISHLKHSFGCLKTAVESNFI